MSMLAPAAAAEPRVAPHDLEAEQSTLGGMLLSEEAVAEVTEITSGGDFYASKHELIFDAVMTLFGRGEPTDVIAVTDQLKKAGHLLKAGGADYLHSLTSYVPTAANAGFYAKIVADKAVLRRLIDAGTKIAQSGYESQGEVEDLVNQAQSEIYRVASQNARDDYVGLSDSLEAAIREIESAQNRGGEMTGIPTGFTDLDSYTHGFHPDS
jgi:Replicative DNA helicase